MHLTNAKHNLIMSTKGTNWTLPMYTQLSSTLRRDDRPLHQTLTAALSDFSEQNRSYKLIKVRKGFTYDYVAVVHDVNIFL